MNNTTLEKMKYLHSCGFKPDMISCGHGMLVPYDPEEKIDYAVELPYFSESLLWSLLPTRFIRDGNEYHLYITNDLELGYVSGKDCPIQLKSWLTLHASLLELATWCVKEGHLKSKEKHGSER